MGEQYSGRAAEAAARAKSNAARKAQITCDCGATDPTWHGDRCGYRTLCCDKCWFENMATEALDALRTFNLFYDDLASSNPGFLGKLCLQNYARMNEALLKSEKVLSKYPKAD